MLKSEKCYIAEHSHVVWLDSHTIINHRHPIISIFSNVCFEIPKVTKYTLHSNFLSGHQKQWSWIGGAIESICGQQTISNVISWSFWKYIYMIVRITNAPWCEITTNRKILFGHWTESELSISQKSLLSNGG